MAEITDHEAILIVTKDIQYLKEWQDKFHREMKESIDDLKNNYSWKIDKLETRTKSLENAWFIVKWVMLLAWVCASLIVYIYFIQLWAVNTIIQEHIEHTDGKV